MGKDGTEETVNGKQILTMKLSKLPHSGSFVTLGIFKKNRYHFLGSAQS